MNIPKFNQSLTNWAFGVSSSLILLIVLSWTLQSTPVIFQTAQYLLNTFPRLGIGKPVPGINGRKLLFQPFLPSGAGIWLKFYHLDSKWQWAWWVRECMVSRLHFLVEEVVEIFPSPGQPYRKFECSTWLPSQYSLTLLETLQAIMYISKFLPS